jgi:hypothetical protein
MLKENACGMKRLLCYVPRLLYREKALATIPLISFFPAFFLSFIVWAKSDFVRVPGY